ncbi:MAG TPA: hypothetical protein VIL74_05950 [Pyrinomonadaceae bacterium]|jgi:hypothetical protein
MSRSKRKTSITGRCAGSEKQDKRDYNRRFRRVCKQFLRIDYEKELPLLEEYSNPWAMNKDGKRWFDARIFPEAMRK